MHNVGPKFFAGGAAIGSTIYFAPFAHTRVGKLEVDPADPTQGTYTDGPEVDYYPGYPGDPGPWVTPAQTGAGDLVGEADEGGKNDIMGWGSAAVGKYFVFGPFNYSGVGVLDTELGTINYYPLNVSGCWINVHNLRGTVFEDDWPNQVNPCPGESRECFWQHLQDSAPSGCFAGAAALGTKVYFTPFGASEVGVFDTATMTWSLIPLNVTLDRYWPNINAPTQSITGGCLDVFRQPDTDCLSSCMHHHDKSTTSYSCHSCLKGQSYCSGKKGFGELLVDENGYLRPEASTPSSPNKFVGAVAHGHHIYFAPNIARYVGALDTRTGRFELIDTPKDYNTREMSGANYLSGNDLRYRGGVAVGKLVVFASFSHVGRMLVLDTEKYLNGDAHPIYIDNAQTLPQLGGHGCTRAQAQGYLCTPYWGAAALGQYVFFAPWSEDNVSPAGTLYGRRGPHSLLTNAA